MVSKVIKTRITDITVTWEDLSTSWLGSGFVMADVEIRKWSPEMKVIKFSYGLYALYFNVEDEKSKQLATRCLLGFYPTITVKLFYQITWKDWNTYRA